MDAFVLFELQKLERHIIPVLASPHFVKDPLERMFLQRSIPVIDYQDILHNIHTPLKLLKRILRKLFSVPRYQARSRQSAGQGPMRSMEKIWPSF